MAEPLTIATPAGTLDALAAGPADGRRVLLLHGFPQCSREWDRQLEALAAFGYRAVAVDQRGYSPGLRPDPVEQYARPVVAADVVAVLDALGWERADLVGHDWGAVAAWDVAITAPDRLRTLTAISVPHPDVWALAVERDPGQRERLGYMAFMARDDAAALLREHDGRRQRAMFQGVVPHDQADAHVARLAAPGAMEAALRWYRALPLGGPSGPVTTPTLFVWGSEDLAFGRAAAEAVAEQVTGPYRLAVLDGITHWVPEQAPEQLNGLLLEHLAAHPG
ncbi:alpha/beta fold hydrolase [Patulibacter defluvii]|uniref:alpha/beta fold hydrolase n=1 Tax=Patulibacter defluvii TaxID=3095358 RepID=UPI002A761806|nr:alpha/beta hydrolase [Patulibacter sp. DM4]